jgi:hypothetical protein
MNPIFVLLTLLQLQHFVEVLLVFYSILPEILVVVSVDFP